MKPLSALLVLISSIAVVRTSSADPVEKAFRDLHRIMKVNKQVKVFQERRGKALHNQWARLRSGSQSSSNRNETSSWAANDQLVVDPLALKADHARLVDKGNSRIIESYVLTKDGKLSRAQQPAVLIDRSDKRLKKVIRKAARVSADPNLSSWQKINALQDYIELQVKHADITVNVSEAPRIYQLYNRNVMKAGGIARLSDYLRIGEMSCREYALITHLALEAAGFKVRTMAGSIKNSATLAQVGEHAWNEVELDGRWFIVDTQNRHFTGADATLSRSQGTASPLSTAGFIWQPNPRYLRVLSATEAASRLHN